MIWLAAIGGGAFVLSFRGIDIASAPLGAAIVGSLGVASAGSAWLAFLPPAGHLRRVRARAGVTSQSHA